MQLSKHFSTDELKCPCCNNCYVVPELVEALEALRTFVGKPILINSGYRCVTYNKQIGGEKSSMHVAGKAVDIVVKGMALSTLLTRVESVPAFRGIGIYPAEKFLHVDVREMKARWSRIKGNYVSYELGKQAITPKGKK